MKNKYRQKYLEYYKIECDSTFDIHHIDENRENDNIGNLILLPKKIHRIYHNNIDIIKGIERWECFDIYREAPVDLYIEAIKKVFYLTEPWVGFKQMLDFYKETKDDWLKVKIGMRNLRPDFEFIYT